MAHNPIITQGSLIQSLSFGTRKLNLNLNICGVLTHTHRIAPRHSRRIINVQVDDYAFLDTIIQYLDLSICSSCDGHGLQEERKGVVIVGGGVFKLLVE